MRVKRLPSGSYQAVVSIGKDATGKYRYKSFTHKDKKTAVRMAASYQDSHREFSESMTVGECVASFLDAQNAVLSPGTMRGYNSIGKMLKLRQKALWNAQAHDLNRSMLQNFVKNMHQDGSSPKTIRNYIGLLSASLKAQGIIVPAVTIPRRTKPDYHIPSEDDVRRLAETASGTEMEIPLTLAVLGLRRGEICALEAKDLQENVIHIRRAVVYDSDGNLRTKDPKTASSDRYVQIPSKTAETIRRQGYVTNLSPRQLSRRFVRLLKDSGIEPFRFHDLRHFFVSYCHTVLKLSDAQIQALGGWSSSHVMTEFYRQTMNQKQAAMLVANKVAQMVQ